MRAHGFRKISTRTYVSNKFYFITNTRFNRIMEEVGPERPTSIILFFFYNSSAILVPVITRGYDWLTLELDAIPFLASILILSKRNSAGLGTPGTD